MKRLFSLLLILAITTFVIASVPTQSFKLETQTQTEFCISNESALQISFINVEFANMFEQLQTYLYSYSYNYEMSNSETLNELLLNSHGDNYHECNILNQNYKTSNIWCNQYIMQNTNMFEIIEKNKLNLIVYPITLNSKKYPLKKPLKL